MYLSKFQITPARNSYKNIYTQISPSFASIIHYVTWGPEYKKTLRFPAQNFFATIKNNSQQIYYRFHFPPKAIRREFSPDCVYGTVQIQPDRFVSFRRQPVGHTTTISNKQAAKEADTSRQQRCPKLATCQCQPYFHVIIRVLRSFISV